MKYLEIYPSEVAAQKISGHLDKMLEDPPKVYRKTLKRYQKLAILLLDCVDKINRLIQQEALLSSESSEFDELSYPDSGQIERKLEEVQSKSKETSNFLSKDVKLADASSSSVNRQTISKYAEVFNEGAEISFGVSEVDDCARLINSWFTSRFIPKRKNTNFKYQIAQLPLWTAYIVVAYGKHRADGTLNEFKLVFDSWLNSIETDMNNCWALPVNVYSLLKNASNQDYTLDAVAIYDILMERCYYKLTESNVAIRLDPNIIAIAVKQHNPELSNLVSMRFSSPDVLRSKVNLTYYEVSVGGNS